MPTPVSKEMEALQALVHAAREAFPDGKYPSVMQKALEEAQAAASKSVTKDIHKQTTAMGVAKSKLEQIQTKKKQHVDAWQKHLVEAFQLWETQIEQYQEITSKLDAAEKQTRKELREARKNIAALTSGNQLEVQTIDDEDEQVMEVEEKKGAKRGLDIEELQANVKKIIETCAVQAGLDLSMAKRAKTGNSTETRPEQDL